MDLDDAIRDERIVARYTAHIVVDHRVRCVFWTGAISGRGHGRFWIAPGKVVIAHRFTYALAHGPHTLNPRQVLAHTCDEPLCQNPDHLRLSTNRDNTESWSRRRTHFAGPLADPRGSLTRAHTIRDLLRAGTPVPDALAQQRTPLEDGQLPLLTLPGEPPCSPS